MGRPLRHRSLVVNCTCNVSSKLCPIRDRSTDTLHGFLDSSCLQNIVVSFEWYDKSLIEGVTYVTSRPL